jgi:hypothetical protein
MSTHDGGLLMYPIPSQDHRSAIAGHPARSSRRPFRLTEGSLSHPASKIRDVNRPSLCSASYYCRSLYYPVVSSLLYRIRWSITLDRFIPRRIACRFTQLLYNLRGTLLKSTQSSSYLSPSSSGPSTCHITMNRLHRLDALKALS